MTSSVTRGRFAWHELMTPDVEGAKAFYTKVIGWTADEGMMNYTRWMAGTTPIGGVMALHPGAVAMGARPAWTAYLETADVDATIALCTKLGGGVHVPANSVPTVGRFAILHDPQGATFAVITPEMAAPPETDPKNLEFSWHELATTDYKAAVAFYGELFGWEKKSEFDMGNMGIYHMFGRDRFTYGGMMNKPAEMAGPPGWLHYVMVDSADTAADRAKSAGGTLLMGPHEVPGGDRIAQLLDPQGVMFAVHSKKK